MKDLEKPAKRIFSQNKEVEKIVKTRKSGVEKTLAQIAVENFNPKMSIKKKRTVEDIDEKRKKQKKDLQTETIVHDNLSHNTTENSKSESSDKKRLKSLKEWKKQLNQQKTAMKKALSTTNSKDGLNKKVIFDCEESEINETDVSDENNAHSETVPKAKKLKPLFDESSLEESESEEKLNERFRYKKEFEGKSGKKLKVLQKKYGGDDRFKLSEKFLDKEDAKDNVEELTDNDAEDAIKDEEIQNTLNIADQILQNNEIRIKSKSNKKFKDVSALRLDPDKKIHKELIQSPNKKPKKKTVTFETTTKCKEIPVVPEVKNSVYYEVQTSLKEAFTNSADQPFSLLASFANPNVPVEDEISSSDEEANGTVLEKSDLLEDNGSSDEEVETPLTDDETISLKQETAAACLDKTFFFLADDKRLQEGIKKFHRTLEEEEMWKQWKEQHKKMKSLFHTRQKHIVRRLNYKKASVFKNKTGIKK